MASWATIIQFDLFYKILSCIERNSEILKCSSNGLVIPRRSRIFVSLKKHFYCVSYCCIMQWNSCPFAPIYGSIIVTYMLISLLKSFERFCFFKCAGVFFWKNWPWSNCLYLRSRSKIIRCSELVNIKKVIRTISFWNTQDYYVEHRQMKYKRRGKILKDAGGHVHCSVFTLFIAPMLHMFFNAVNVATSLNVTDGFKGNDLAD